MRHNQDLTRTERFKKRRNNERLLFSFIAVALLFFVLLLFFIFADKDDAQQDLNKSTDEVSETESEVDDSTSKETASDEASQIENTDNLPEDTVIQQIETTDPNVIEAYVGNWPVIETNQEEPHTTNYEEGSADRKEIKEAILLVTNIKEEDLIEHWVGNGGEQKVIATVEDTSNEHYYRIYLSWIETEGWQVTLVEGLKEIVDL